MYSCLTVICVKRVPSYFSNACVIENFIFQVNQG